jgi:cell division septum initiation protein DivIVA
MATKKLRVENELLRSEIEELKSQLLYKINEDLKTQTTAASKSSRTAEAKEAKEAKDTIERTNSEHRIKISNRRAIQRCNVSSFFYAKLFSLLARRRSSQPVQRVYWPENVMDWLGKWRPTCV